MGRTALARLKHVDSHACLTHLSRLAGELRARKGNVYVRECSAELDRKLQLVACQVRLPPLRSLVPYSGQYPGSRANKGFSRLR